MYIEETNKSDYVILRGHIKDNDKEEEIFIDESMRERLGKLKTGSLHYTFHFERADVCGKIKFAWFASGPAYQVSVRIAIILGAISIVFGVISIGLSLR